MSGPLDCQVIGRWRIVESDMWDRDYLDLVEPASITIDRGGRGELAFGVVNASLDLEYSQTVVFFTFEGSDEGDEVNGSGSAELLDDGTLEIEIAFHLGDEAVLRAKREGSSRPASCFVQVSAALPITFVQRRIEISRSPAGRGTRLGRGRTTRE